MRTKLKIIAVLLSVLGGSIYLSGRNALGIAEHIFRPVESEEQYHHITLSFGKAFPGANRSSIFWRIGYRPKQGFGDDAEVYVSLFGKVICTNPTDLRERILVRQLGI